MIKSVIIDDDVVAKIDELKSLAPLHNPAHLTGYYAFKEAIPNAGAVAVFDTAFHQTLEPKSYIYPIPYKYYVETKYVNTVLMEQAISMFHLVVVK